MVDTDVIRKRCRHAEDELGPLERVERGEGELEPTDQVVGISPQIGDQDRTRVRLKDVVPLVCVDGLTG